MPILTLLSLAWFADRLGQRALTPGCQIWCSLDLQMTHMSFGICLKALAAATRNGKATMSPSRGWTSIKRAHTNLKPSIQDITKHTARLLNSFHTKTITTLKAAVSSPKQWLKNYIHFMFTAHVSTRKLLTVRKVYFVPFFSFLIYSVITFTLLYFSRRTIF